MYPTVDPVVAPDSFQPLKSKVEQQYCGAVDTYLWSLQSVFTNKYLPSASDCDTTIYQDSRV